jgi:hypothetical protein
LNHRFRDALDAPAILGFLEVQVAQKQTDDSSVHGKSLVTGFTTYQTYDPVVLSLTGSLQFNLKRELAGNNYQPGHRLSLVPSVGFAVNDKVTLTTGVSWSLQQADKVNGEKVGIKLTRTELNQGLGYALGKNDTLNLSAGANISGESSASIRINWMHKVQ